MYPEQPEGEMSLATMEKIAQVMAGPSADCLLAYWRSQQAMRTTTGTTGDTHVVKVAQGGFGAVVVVGQRIADHHDVGLFDHCSTVHRSILESHVVLSKGQHVLSNLRPGFIRLDLELLAECIGIVQCLCDNGHCKATGVDMVGIFILDGQQRCRHCI